MKNPSKIQNCAFYTTIICAGLLAACGASAPLVQGTSGSASPVSVQAVSLSKPDTRVTAERGNSLASVGVVVAKADPNKRFVLTPLGEESDELRINLRGSDYIKVIGSYFPKVVYRSPYLDAKLLMRVAPGTVLPLEKLDDGWYRVSTDKGVGYLRTIDGEPTSAKS